jgi:head-tail adaptor
MTDKERIEKFVETLMRLKNMLATVKDRSNEEHVKKDIDQISRTIEFVIGLTKSMC